MPITVSYTHLKRAVKPFDHLLVGAELLRARIIVSEPNYLGNVKLEVVSQLPYELLGGQRIGKALS